MSRAEIQNFKREIIGNESMDLRFLFYDLATGGRETYYLQNHAVLFSRD